LRVARLRRVELISLWLSDSVRLAIMDAGEAKACALRSTAAKPTVCPCFGDSEWMDAWSRSLKSSISGSAPITPIARSKAPTERSISCESTRTDPTGLSRCTQAQKLRLSRHNPGSTCVKQGNRLTTYRLIAAAQPRNGGIAEGGGMGPEKNSFSLCSIQPKDGVIGLPACG